ncbi:MAG: NAD(P)H-binding protein [Gammaproteobacteria bacterium]
MIVVTAPTGDIGRQVLNNILDSGEPIRVIARDPSRIPAHIRERVEIVQGSHADIDVVNEAFAGAEAVFWLVPPDPRASSVEAAYVDFTRPACEAIRSQGVKRLVDISPLGRGLALAAHAGYVTASLAMDDLIASTGVDFRALTMPSFMDNILLQLEPIRTRGNFASPIDGDRKLPACATRDIAAVAARLLLDRSWSGQGHVAVLGPADLSFNEMAKIMSWVLGKTVRYQQISFTAYKSRFVDLGMSEAMAQGMTDMAAAKNEGLDNAEPRTPGNTTPTSFRQWCEEVLRPALSAGRIEEQQH